MQGISASSAYTIYLDLQIDYKSLLDNRNSSTEQKDEYVHRYIF
jgi:hypothetical protein